MTAFVSIVLLEGILRLKMFSSSLACVQTSSVYFPREANRRRLAPTVKPVL